MSENEELPLDDVDEVLKRETHDGPGDLDNLPDEDYDGDGE